MKKAEGTLLLSRNDVSQLLGIEECIAAVEHAFKLHGEGTLQPPGILGVHAVDGGFHIKAGIMGLARPYFVAKINANFPRNIEIGSPTIRGVIVVCDAGTGEILAVMDSIEITIVRTGAATAVAAKYLAKKDAKKILIWGCGNQGRISLQAIMKVRKLERVYAYDIDHAIADQFANECAKELGLPIDVVDDIAGAAAESDICVTCTPSKEYFLKREYITPGTFIAAVGADSEDKQELEPALLLHNKVVADIAAQSSSIGELSHVLNSGTAPTTEVVELGQIVAGIAPGRTGDDEIIIFDSTGMALQDVAAAAIVYERAAKNGFGQRMSFA